MALKINKSTIENLVAKHLNEALQYNKKAKQYVPNYTGNRHSDAGKYASKFDDYNEFNYGRNDYKWSDKEKQDRFNRLQFKYDHEVDTTDPDTVNASGAEDYIKSHEYDVVMEKTVQELKPTMKQVLNDFMSQAIQKHPILKQDEMHVSDLLDELKDVYDDWEYDYRYKIRNSKTTTKRK